MAGNTGIKNRSEYIQRLLKEDKKLRGKDALYGAYLQALEELAKMTNAIYEENEGQLDKKSHGDLVNKYLEVAELGNVYKEKGTDKTRVTVVNHILKVVSKDLKALNSMNKENPGMIDDAFEKSRAAKVELPESLTNRVGGQMSDRFPMKDSKSGKKGFFTARTDTAQDQKWEKIFDSIEKLGLPNDQMEKLNVLKTNHKLRSRLQKISLDYNKTDIAMQNMRGAFTSALGLAKGRNNGVELLKNDEKLNEAMKILTTDGLSAMMPYNVLNRLGYDPYTRNDNKNAAMYEVAKLLGCERIIAKATPMVVVAGNRVLKGTYMEHAEGSDIANFKKDDELLKYDNDYSPYNKNLYCDLADMQVLDYICGNIDRHKGNMLYKTEMDNKGNVKLTGIVGIDNDASFPEEKIEDWEFHHNFDNGNSRFANIYKPENFRYVTKKTADVLKDMTRAKLETTLRGHNLSQAAIDLAWERTKHVQKVLEKSKNISFADDLQEDVTRDKKDIANPFCTLPQFKNEPSIFHYFDVQMKGYAKHGLKKNSDTELETQDTEMKIPEYKEAGRAMAMVMESEKISEMSSLMKRVNRLKSPSKEFSLMSSAMYELNEYMKEMSAKRNKGEDFDNKDYKGYEDRLNTLSAATKNYIQKKGIAPKTEKGRERLDASMSIENRVEDLIRNFETEKKRDEKHLEAPVMENENEKVL